MHASTLGSEYRHGAVRVAPETDGINVLCLDGEFDLANASALADQIDLALERGTGLILDLSEATFIDSSVIAVVMRASKTAAARRQTVVLQLGSAQIVERVLEIVGIERIMPRAQNRQEAVRIIQQHARAM